MPGIFDIFKSGETKRREQEDLQEITAIRAKREVEHEVFDALSREFTFEGTPKLRQAVSGQEPPVAFLRNENQAFSLWYRLPVRGESRAIHVIDYAIFRGTHRFAQKLNPDFVIECRQFESGRSNRADSRIVRDVVGLSVDVLPGMAILATNRELADVGKELAGSYGIQVVNMSDETAGRELLDLITSDKQTTRQRIMGNLERTMSKIDSLVTRRTATPWGKRILEERQEMLKERVFKELSRGKTNARALAKRLRTQEDFILNELYSLEKEGKARMIERAMEGEKDNLWAANPSEKKSGSSR